MEAAQAQILAAEAEAKRRAEAEAEANRRAEARAAAESSYRTALEAYSDKVGANRARHGRRYGEGERVLCFAVTAPGEGPTWKAAVVKAVGHREPGWPTWKEVPYQVVLDDGSGALWVSADTDRWVRSAELFDLEELRGKLSSEHGVASPAPIPGSPGPISG